MSCNCYNEHTPNSRSTLFMQYILDRAHVSEQITHGGGKSVSYLQSNPLATNLQESTSNTVHRKWKLCHQTAQCLKYWKSLNWSRNFSTPWILKFNTILTKACQKEVSSAVLLYFTLWRLIYLRFLLALSLCLPNCVFRFSTKFIHALFIGVLYVLRILSVPFFLILFLTWTL